MARLTKGITGGFRGTIGNVVGYTQKHANIIRSRELQQQKPTSNMLSPNGKRLKLCVDYWALFRPPLQALIEVYYPEALIEFNQYIRSSFKQNVDQTPYTISPFIFGSDQFRSSFKFVPPGLPVSNNLEIGFVNGASIMINHTQPIFRTIRYTSYNNGTSIVQPILQSNQGSISFNGLTPMSGDWAFLMIFVYVNPSLTKSELAICMYRKP